MAVRLRYLRRTLQQLVIFHVHDPRGCLGPFQRSTSLQEMPSFISGQGSVGDTVETMARKYDVRAEAVRSVQDLRLRIEVLNPVIEAVHVLPHFTRNPIADGARVLSHPIEAGDNRISIILPESEKL